MALGLTQGSAVSACAHATRPSSYATKPWEFNKTLSIHSYGESQQSGSTFAITA